MSRIYDKVIKLLHQNLTTKEIVSFYVELDSDPNFSFEDAVGTLAKKLSPRTFSNDPRISAVLNEQ